MANPKIVWRAHNDLCPCESIPAPHAAIGKPLDGHSLRALLEDPPSDNWDGPDYALSFPASNERLEINEPGKVQNQHASLRTRRFPTLSAATAKRRSMTTGMTHTTGTT